MKTFSTKFLQLTLVLIALTLAVPAFSAQRPFVKKSKSGGNGGDDCFLNESGESGQYVDFIVSIESITYLDFCDLHVGFQFDDDPMTYIQLSDWIQNDLGSWESTVTITFPTEYISTRCDEQTPPSPFSFGLFCLDNGEYNETNYDSYADLWDIRVCCDDSSQDLSGDENQQNPGSDPGSDPGDGRGRFITSNTIDATSFGTQFTQSDSNEATENMLTDVDYYVYDRHGNQVLTLKRIPLEQSIQYLLQNSNIRSGLYFIKYFDGKVITTKKIFKQ